jgi:hypothetical protein
VTSGSEAMQQNRGALRLHRQHSQVGGLARRMIVVAGETDAVDLHWYERGDE